MIAQVHPAHELGAGIQTQLLLIQNPGLFLLHHRPLFPPSRTPGGLAVYFVKAGHRIPIFAVTYSGVLRIEDPGSVQQALINGIGSKKTYGCGLLTVARIKESYS